MSAESPVVAALTRFFETQESPGTASVYLFGSHAEGRAHRDSDVDVGVLLDRAVFPEARQRFEERVRLASLLPAPLRVRAVDVVVLNDAPPGLGRRIVHEGRRVFCRDGELDHGFVRDVQLRAADLDPFLKRTRRLKLAALK